MWLCRLLSCVYCAVPQEFPLGWFGLLPGRGGGGGRREEVHPLDWPGPRPCQQRRLRVLVLPVLHLADGKVLNIEEETDRREGKGRRCSSTELIHFPCRTTVLAPGWFEETDEKKNRRMLGRMDASEKWMIIWFTPHQTTTISKWMFFPIFFFKLTVLLIS